MTENWPILSADCSSCAALCCMALAFDKGPRFALDKPAGVPCPNLSRHKCSIHSALDDKGYAGCTAYSCNGAGQRVVQELYDGQSWQDDPALIAPMIESFRHLRQLHDVLELVSISIGRLPKPEQDALYRLAAPIVEDLTPQKAESLAVGPLPKQIMDRLRALKDYLVPDAGPLQR